MRNRFDNQLAEMNNELISMGALCENAIASAVKALLERSSATRRFCPPESLRAGSCKAAVPIPSC